jgi:ABC-2 type transport system permease protein
VNALSAAVVEIGKVPAFLRRDLLIALSYRMSFVSELIVLGAQMAVFGFVGRLVDPARLPAYGGSHASYMEFVAIGMVVSLVVGVMTGRIATAMRQEQLQGTLESLLATPTRLSTVQFGSVAFDLIWVPVRLALFLLVVVLTFGLDFEAGGVIKSVVLLLAFLPFVWGLGLVSAGAILTFRRGGNATALVGSVLGVFSGAYFPLALFPDWLQALAEINPFAVVLEGMRGALLGGTGWGALASDLIILVPTSLLALFAGMLAFRLALAREHRNGTLGLY